MRARRLEVLAPVALVGIVALSTLLHFLAGRRLHGLWILPDEAIYAARALALWRHGAIPSLRGEGSGYGFLYPAVAGVPFVRGSIAHGYAWLKPLQALVVSLSAVPVYRFGRRVMPARYALIGAALTVASPLLLYSGLVMTEVLFYPVAAVALLAIVRAVAAGTVGRQVVAFLAILAAVLTRPQAVAFLGVLALAAVLAHGPSRRLRAFWPTWLLLLAGVVVLAAFPRVVGSYAGTLRGSYPLGSALRLTYDHLAYVALATGLVPAVALVVLATRSLRGREENAEARALVAVTASATIVLVVQVGFFAARYAPHLLGRDLAALPPLYFLVLALWLARGAPRGLVAGPVAAFAVLALVLLAPWDRLVDPLAYADTLDLQLIARVHGHDALDVVMVFAIVVLALTALVPRRAALVLPAVVLATLVGASVVASNGLAQVVAAAQTVLGPDRSWIDHAANGRVAYVYDDGPFWNIVWQERFWNPSIDRVYDLAPAVVPGPMPQRSLRVPPSGRLPLRERYVVATDTHTFVGTPTAHLATAGVAITGLTLWRLDGAPRLSTTLTGTQPDGDIATPATLRVYGCTRGSLELTLLPKATAVVHVLFDGRDVLTRSIAGQPYVNLTVPVPVGTRGSCTFTIVPAPLLGSTRIAFVR